MIRIRRRYIIAVHRWLGLVSAVFLLILALTGLVLNHTELLGLDSIRTNNPYILKRYGMATSAELEAFRIDETNKLVVWDNQLLVNGRALDVRGYPLGIWRSDHLTAIATPEAVILLDVDASLVEILDGASLPPGELSGIGEDATGQPVLFTEENRWVADPEWLDYEPYTGKSEMNSLERMTLSADEESIVLGYLQGEGVSLYRILLDLHSGRLLGLPGRTVMDLAAVAILVLVLSGISSFWKARGSNSRDGRDALRGK